MRVRRTDANGDYQFGSSQADFWKDQPDGVAQVVRQRLALYLSEWFLDLAEGTEWNTRVLGTDTSSVYDMTIRARILGTQGVASLISYASQKDPNTRRLGIQAVVDTIFGPLPTQPAVIVRPPFGAPDISILLLGADSVILEGRDKQLLAAPK